ncbi:MAG: hypothetical protein COW54_09970 [Rhodobacteraceae bacterium CG17_big_fil_post_rev_8_21_14_2_50_63_15]|nr:hypothetical protein [Roseovarius sp.]PIV78453.1 MAG: hypothetical protein COW54_09970 [Rhodobacteraceae bacterium CG17_big_fil_post_rev_8_21_14_2_50_63_15]
MEKHTIVWRGIGIEITYTPKKWGVTDHIELRTEGKTPLPVTETGYRSEYFPLGSVAEYGDAAAFVTAWLDHEAARKGWGGAQLSLF